VTEQDDRTEIVSGLRGLVVMKTADSAFSGFPRDSFTTLPETAADRILATSITADVELCGRLCGLRAADGRATAISTRSPPTRASRSRQTLYAMGHGALAACRRRHRIQLALPNLTTCSWT